MGTSGQLALPVGLREEATLDNFFPRAALRPLLAALTGAQREPLSFLHGAAAVGKSHLLQGLCHRVSGAVYLPLDSLAALPAAELLQDLEQAPLIALDDVHCVAGDSAWEEALFHLVNRARDASCPLWISATVPASSLAIELADLRSRLAGGVTWAIPESDDAEKALILQFRAERRGLPLADAVARYLCTRESRALDDLMATLEHLDDASLQLQRPLTVPMVKAVMGW